ncbi:DUF4935 domain-containing protein [Candidatus Dojkabacteria bacterium]|nr:DUF4935 domain-containing protein [Candidatus Dojkabacteria bacterium]
MKNIFIDTNIFLDFYHYSDDDLSKLNNLDELISDLKDINLLLTDQVIQEYKRNRDSKIADAMKQFQQQSIKINFPRLFDQFKTETRELKKHIDIVSNLKSELEKQIYKSIIDKTLVADQVIDKFFQDKYDFLYKDRVLLTLGNDVTNAERRINIGNPPGKKGSLGDAINWEIILRSVPQGEIIYVISGDSDFASPLNSKKIHSFLEDEWKSTKKAEIMFYTSISEFFASEYGAVELDEIKKDTLIQQLEESPSFDRSREILKSLEVYSDFSKEQINSIVIASLKNDQVWNAHNYSPDLVGGRLQNIIKNHEEQIDYDLYQHFCNQFDIKPIIRSEDLPF